MPSSVNARLHTAGAADPGSMVRARAHRAVARGIHRRSKPDSVGNRNTDVRWIAASTAAGEGALLCEIVGVSGFRPAGTRVAGNAG
jgi:hypothetical protein